MMRPVCLSPSDKNSGCFLLQPGRLKPAFYGFLFATLGDGQALRGADINTGIAFNTQVVEEHGLDVTVQAAFHFLRSLLGIETPVRPRW